MRMMDELRPLFLYSANKKVYAPIDEKDKKHGSAILLLTPNMETSSRLMKLPYIYNPDLFNSFYIDRNVMAYIDKVGEENIEFDEQEENAISEAMMVSWIRKTKVRFLEGTSIMDKRYVEEVFNPREISKKAQLLKMSKVPEELRIFVHPTSADLQKDAPKSLMNLYDGKLYSYSKDNEVHIISKLSYDESIMGGPYEVYLSNELIYTLMMCYNSELHYIPCKAIAMALSGLTEWKKDNDATHIHSVDRIDNLSKIVNVMKKKNDYNIITKYIRTADVNIFKNYMARTALQDLHRIIFEAELSYFERQRLLPSEFGIPEKRKYPMPDEEHTRAAIKMFNHCDPDDEEELAEAILKRIKRFGITNVKVSAANRFYKYWREANKDNKSKNEAVVMESFIDSDYEDVLKICSHLSKEEHDRISFYDTYRNSQFVIKRFIERIGGEPAGFLDVYLFPSRPEVAQITIAVDNRFRGHGVANTLVNKMIEADLPKTHGFNVYYWTAHPENYASINLATKYGFDDTGNLDKYGRKVFLRVAQKPEDILRMLPDEMVPSQDDAFIESSNALVSHDLALITEANDEKMYSQRLRKYLYAERIRNSRAVLNLYEKIKETNPDIRRMYPRIKMYKKFNAYIDLSYYNGLFLSKNNYKLDRAVNFYFEFMCRLINNKEINDEYKKKTIFIPVDTGVWPVEPMTDIYDYRKNINPISVIFRLVRTNSAILKKELGNKDIIFVGSRGYFKIDFNKFEIKDLNRIKINLRKLMSIDEKIEDDFEYDELGDDGDDKVEGKGVNSSKAITANVINTIERGTGISINNISSASTKNATSTGNALTSSHSHLKITTDNLIIDKKLVEEDNGIAIITIDPDGASGFQRIQGSLLNMANKIKSYCIPEVK